MSERFIHGTLSGMRFIWNQYFMRMRYQGHYKTLHARYCHKHIVNLQQVELYYIAIETLISCS